MALLLLIVACVAGLVLVPLGLPGLWLMLAAGAVHAWLAPPPALGWGVVAIGVVVAMIAEVLEFTLAARATQRWGGSRRAAWGSILGGFAGAVVGVPVPIVGPVLGALAGAFAGALVGEWLWERDHRAATRAATGALIGRALGMAAKSMAGCLVAALLVGGALAA
jgi:uncharacterized protein YqgC (DUF456 family)